MPPMNVLIKPASGLCNMHCDYCFYCDEISKRSQEVYGLMSDITIKNVIRKTISHAEGSITYAFQGGEPTLCGLGFFEKVIALQKQYNRHGIRIYNSFQTNGYLIDDSWCEFFQKNHVLVGLSVDGVQETHDLFRHTKTGEPTYKIIEQAARKLDRYKVEYNILIVVNKKTAERVKEIYKDYRKHGWRYQQYIACLDPMGEEHGKNEYALTPDEYGEFLVKLFDLWYQDYQKNQAPYIRQFYNYVQIMTGQCPESCEQTGQCGIQIVVEADGSVFPCDFYVMDPYYLGNFNKDRIQVINNRRKEIGFIERSRKLSRECRECKFYFICRGGCQRNRDFYEEKQGYKNYFCKSYQAFFEHSLERITKIADEL